MRSTTKFLATLAVGTLALTGCSASAPESTPEKLTIWMMTGGPGDNALIQEVNEEFKKKYPDTTVNIEIQQWDSIATKLTTALASNNSPDIVEMGNTQTPLQTYSGGLSNITEYKKDFEDSAQWLPGLAAPSTYDGDLYATPLYGGTKVVMYNTELFTAAGITTPPSTLEELLANCDTLAASQAGVDSFAPFYMPGQYWFAGAPFVFAAGGEIATEKDGTWTAEMSSEKSQRGLADWRNFHETCSIPSSVGVNTNNPDQTQLFADGKAAMLYVKAWEPASVLEKNPALEGKIGFFAMPGNEADRTQPVIVAGSTIGIATQSKNQEQARDWLTIVTGKKFQQRMATELNLLPIVPEFIPSSGVTEQLQIAAEAATVSKALPASPGWAALESERYNEQFFSSIAGGADIPTAAAEYDRYVSEALNSLKR